VVVLAYLDAGQAITFREDRSL